MRSAYQLAVLLPHPIHYVLGWLRELAAHPRIDLMLYLGSDFGLREGVDPTFGATVRWYDASVLDGIPHKFLAKTDGRARHRVLGGVPLGLWRELRSRRYDALLVRGYAEMSTYWAYVVAAAAGVPVVFHGETFLRSGRDGIRRRLRDVAIRTVVHRSAAFLPVGTQSYRFYRHFGAPEEGLFLAPYSVDNRHLAAECSLWRERRGMLREELGIGEDTPVILSVGKLVPRKRPMDLLQAFEGIQHLAHLVVVGDGPLMREMCLFVRTRGLTGTHFVGFQGQAELPRFYALADVFAFPSGYEPWGLVVNEAMCCGLPVIVSDGVVSQHDLVRHGENGFVYPAGDVQALRRHLALLVESAELRQRMGECSRQIISSWSYREGVRAMLDALGYVRGQRAAGRADAVSRRSQEVCRTAR